MGRAAAQMVALVIVLVALERYGSPALAGFATFMSLIPGLLVSPIAGTLLDRFGRRRLIVLDHLIATGALLLLAVLLIADLLPAPLFLLIVALQSLTFPLSTVGMRVLFPLVVPRPLWERANAIDSNGYAVGTVVGPALAGATVAALQGPGGLLASAAAFAAAAAFTSRAPDSHVRTAHGPLLRSAWEGVVHVVRHPTLRGLAVSVSLTNVANGAFFIVVPVLVLGRFEGSSALVGQIFAAGGAVAFVSVLLMGRLATDGRERPLMLAAVVVSGAAVALVIVRGDLTALVAAVLIRGIAEGVYDVPMFTLRQRRTDHAWLGRAFAVSMALNFIGYPVGSAIGGSVSATSPDLALAAALVFSLLGAVALYLLVPRR